MNLAEGRKPQKGHGVVIARLSNCLQRKEQSGLITYTVETSLVKHLYRCTIIRVEECK